MMVDQSNVFASTEIADAAHRGPEYFDQSRGMLKTTNVDESGEDLSPNMNQCVGLTWPGGLADKIGKVQILPQVTHRSEYIFHFPLGFSNQFLPGGLCKLQVPQQCDDFCQGRTRLIDVSLFCKKEALEQQQQRYEEQAPDLLRQSMPKKTLLNTPSYLQYVELSGSTLSTAPSSPMSVFSTSTPVLYQEARVAPQALARGKKGSRGRWYMEDDEDVYMEDALAH